jgi:predicted branched-subunit amino acid permease
MQISSGAGQRRWWWQRYEGGALTALPLAVPIAALAVVFGASALAAGLSRGAAIAMSALTFAGSPQFAALSLSADKASIGLVAAIVTCISSRFAAMSFAASPALAGGWLERVGLAQLVVDETWAIAYRADRRAFDRDRLIGSALVLYGAHVTGTVVGTYVASSTVEPARWGLDAALPALFAVLIWPHLRHTEARMAAAVSAGVTLALAPVLPPGVPILAGVSMALFGARR